VNLGEVVAEERRWSGQSHHRHADLRHARNAEPYFAVNTAWQHVVLGKRFRPHYARQVENIDASFELLGRGHLFFLQHQIENAIFGIDRKTPLELFEARNSVRIARIALADKYAASTFSKAEQQLRNAEEVYAARATKNPSSRRARRGRPPPKKLASWRQNKRPKKDAQAKIAGEKRAAEEREARARADAASEIKRARKLIRLAHSRSWPRPDAERMKQEAGSRRRSRAPETGSDQPPPPP